MKDLLLPRGQIETNVQLKQRKVSAVTRRAAPAWRDITPSDGQKRDSRSTQFWHRSQYPPSAFSLCCVSCWCLNKTSLHFSHDIMVSNIFGNHLLLNFCWANILKNILKVWKYFPNTFSKYYAFVIVSESKLNNPKRYIYSVSAQYLHSIYSIYSSRVGN